MFRRRRGGGRGGGATLTIAGSSDRESVNGWYRSVGPLEALAQRGHTVRWLDGERLRMPNVLDDVDVVHIHRYWDPTAQALAQAANARGIAVVWDDDDDFASIPRGLPGQQRFAGLRGQRRTAQVRRMLALTDLVTTTGEVLAQRLGELGAPATAVLPNFLPDHFARAGKPPRDGLVLGWMAGLEHQFDYDRLRLRTVFEGLLERNPQLTIASIGVGLGLSTNRYDNEKLVAFDDLPARMGRFDVGLAPLTDVPFNQARSDVKLKEYAAVGVPWLASPVGAYRALGAEQGGELVEDDGWQEAIDRLLREPRERAQRAKRAERWGREQTISRNAGLWEEAFHEAVARAQTRAAAAG